MTHFALTLVSVFAAGALMTGAAIPAMAAPPQQQDGLINVAVGDVTILQDVNIGVAAQVAANICGVKVGPVAVLGTAVDRTGTPANGLHHRPGPESGCCRTDRRVHGARVRRPEGPGHGRRRAAATAGPVQEASLGHVVRRQDLQEELRGRRGNLGEVSSDEVSVSTSTSTSVVRPRASVSTLAAGRHRGPPELVTESAGAASSRRGR